MLVEINLLRMMAFKLERACLRAMNATDVFLMLCIILTHIGVNWDFDILRKRKI